MDTIERIQQGIDFAEANLNNNLTLANVADAASLSLWHFQRTFKAITGETLKNYIRSRRLHLATNALATTNQKVLDVALNAGFESQESFTRAFKKMFNTTPAQYRESDSKPSIVPKIKIDEEYLRHIQSGLSLEPEIYHQRAMTLVGLHTEFIGAYSELNNVSEKLPPLWQAFLSRLGDIPNKTGSICYGAVRQIAPNLNELEYYCGIESTSPSLTPNGMVIVEIPASRYAKFRHQGDVSKIDDTINYIYSTWLPQSGYRHTYGPDLEFYDEQYQPNSDTSVMHYAIPIA